MPALTRRRLAASVVYPDFPMSVCEQVSTVGNTDTWRVEWQGDNGVPVDPDEIEGVAMTWEFRDARGAVLTATPQSLAQKKGTGTFEVKFTPTTPGQYTVKPKCVIDGEPASTPTQTRKVVA